MFKNAKSIRIKGKKFKSKNEVYVAPTLNILGLIIRASRPIPKVIEFLKEKGAIIEIIREDGDILLRLTGDFEISKADIDQFLEANPDIKSRNEAEEKQTTEAIAINFRNQIITRMAKIEAMNRTCGFETSVEFMFQSTKSIVNIKRDGGDDSLCAAKRVSLTLPPMIVEFNLPFSFKVEKELAYSMARVYVKKDIKIEAGGKVCFKGGMDNNVGFGYLSDVLTEGVFFINSKEGSVIIEDTTICAGKTLEISADTGNVEVSLTPNIVWHNSPAIPSLTLDYYSRVASKSTSVSLRELQAALANYDREQAGREAEPGNPNPDFDNKDEAEARMQQPAPTSSSASVAKSNPLAAQPLVVQQNGKNEAPKNGKAEAALNLTDPKVKPAPSASPAAAPPVLLHAFPMQASASGPAAFERKRDVYVAGEGEPPVDGFEEQHEGQPSVQKGSLQLGENPPKARKKKNHKNRRG